MDPQPSVSSVLSVVISPTDPDQMESKEAEVETAQLDALIAKIRTVLISAAVTGRIDVREAV